MLAAVLALAAACSSSDGKDPTPTLPPVPTAFPQPTLDADNVSVPLKGFTAKVPADFHLRSNFATDAGARFPTDAFFGPQAENGIQASIALTCYAPEAGKTLEDYRTQWLQFVTAFSSTNIQNTDTTVSGLPALVFTYNQVLHGETTDPTPVPRDYDVQKQDYIVLQDDCRWVIAVLTPPGQLDTYKATIASFIAALKFSTRLN